MAFAIVAGSVKLVAVKPEYAAACTFKQIIQFQMTAAASDTAANIVTIATNDGNAQCLRLLAALANGGVIQNSFVLESARSDAATALTTLHTLTGTATAPVYTWTGTASTPTTLTICLELGCDSSKTPLYFNV